MRRGSPRLPPIYLSAALSALALATPARAQDSAASEPAGAHSAALAPRSTAGPSLVPPQPAPPAASAGASSAADDADDADNPDDAGNAGGDADDAAIAVAAVEVEAAADEGEGGEMAAAAARGLDDTAMVTEIAIAEHAAETASVGELLSRTMGARVRSLGGLGGFSSLSVRGADSGHTAIYVDGVPVSRVATATVNLERFVLDSFSTLELYRGGVPAELGGNALGGALHLRTRVGRAAGERPLTLSTGAGSFGARRARVRWLGGDARDGHHLAVSYTGATGDFSYFNDNGTNLEPGDDGYRKRSNNHFDRVEAVARRRWQRQDSSVELGARISAARQGIPGGAAVQAESAELSSLSQLVDAQARWRRVAGSPALAATAAGFVDLSWQRYRDPEGEIGVGVQDRRYRTISGGARASLELDLGAQHLSAAAVELQIDDFRDRDALSEDDMLRSRGLRLGAGLSLSHEWSPDDADRLLMRPAVRVDWLRTSPLADRSLPVMDDDALAVRSEVLASPRLAARLRVHPGVALKASAGRYARAPTLVELFGDRGFVVGDPTLAAESGLAGDLGVVVAAREALARGAALEIDRAYAEAAAFAWRARDTIGFVTTGGVSGARNLGDTEARGVEAGGTLRLARALTLSGNYTFLTTRQRSPLASYDGKPLPNRPRHQVFGRMDLRGRVWRRDAALWLDATWTSGNYLDRAGNSLVPARQLIGAGVSIELRPGLRLGLEGKNLGAHRVEHLPLEPAPRPDLTKAPRAVADFFGYPLPGRAFYLTAEWQP
ncbi:TonB-dependent receptor plug domain-containing protein [Haliangium ochraceum]|uniref:TonB-dependent receptor n=1 Tax=Haliangium ochraceum (strain DSM 14365 / JCM 11303 / SMP-2) TaxID=502025 RepID=D0LHA8_HALO1|nr:TonB-dependent receptor [Haliangium ochraceum]ACY18253.1 TonB-dependent receptor [Haliangium ochraceum DSM 14365]